MAASLMGSSLTTLSGTIWVFNSVEELKRGSSAVVLSKSISPTDPPDRKLIDFTAGTFSKNNDAGGASFGYFNSANTAQVYTPAGKRPESIWWNSSLYISGDQMVDVAREIDGMSPAGYQVGEARIKGTASIYPGMVVSVNTGELASLTDTWDGLWLVSKVTHSITSTEFTSNLTLVRDKYRRDQAPGSLIPFWTRSTGFPQAPTMRIVDGNWVSTKGRT